MAIPRLVAILMATGALLPRAMARSGETARLAADDQARGGDTAPLTPDDTDSSAETAPLTPAETAPSGETAPPTPEGTPRRGETAPLTPDDPLPPGTPEGIGSCTGLVSHAGRIHTSPLAMPEYLQTVIDPDFGTEITRVSGDWDSPIPNPTADPSLVDATWRAAPAGPLYSKDPAWNADQSLLVVKKGVWGELFVDGTTYQPLFARTRGSQVFTDWRWHPTNAQYTIYVTGAGEVGWWDPRADEVLPKIPAADDLSGCTIGGYEGNVSNDGRFVPVQCTQDGEPVFFVADLGNSSDASAARYPTIRAFDLGFVALDWATVSPLGTYLVASQDWRRVASAPLSPETSAADFSGAFTSGHLDLGIAADGKTEVAYQAGGAAMFALPSGAWTPLSRIAAVQYHSSTRNVAPGAMGWGYGTLESTRGRMRGEIVAEELAPRGRILRLAHHRTSLTSGDHGDEPTYEHMAFGTPSPDGRRVFFRSDWGDEDGPVHGYVVDVRSLCPPPPPRAEPADAPAPRGPG